MNSKLLMAGILVMALARGAAGQGNPSIANNGGAEAVSDVGKEANFGELLNRQTGSMQFFGRVAMAAGKLPWDPIPVVVTCDGKVRYNTVADAKGGFYIEPPARNSEVLSQKRDPQHVEPAELVGCSVAAVVEGYVSTHVMIANRSLEDDPSVGTITLTRDERSAGAINSSTTQTAPPEAQREFEKAHSDDLAGHAASARRHLQRSVSLDPNFAEAWYHLARLEEDNNPQSALSDFRKAAAADPRYISPWEPMAALAATEKKWQAVVDATNQALRLDPAGTPEVWYYNAVGNYNLGNRTLAEGSAETSLAMDSSHRAPNTEQLLAVIMAGRGEYEDALEHLRHSLSYTPPGPNADLIRQQIAQLEKVVPQSSK